jgi:nitrogen-specific signal transduction histidine kinase
VETTALHATLFVLNWICSCTTKGYRSYREGSGERRPVNLNALVDESLNLAYHGARAENQKFKIRLDRSFDPATGEVDLFPQEMTRALLNMISNGFYAATKRKAKDWV